MRLEDRQWAGLFLLAGTTQFAIGMIIAEAMDPSYSVSLHTIVSFITFLFAGLSAILAFRILRPPLSYVSVLLGVGSLAALGLYVSKNFLGLGNGGMERMIVYPVLTWGIGFGGYLLGMSHSQRPPAAS